MVFLDTPSRVILGLGGGGAPGHSLGSEPVTVPQLVQSWLLNPRDILSMLLSTQRVGSG